MRTYYKLEDYHYKEIEEAGFGIGVKVYFTNYFNKVVEGVIKEYDITLEGCILFRIEYQEKIEYDDPPDVWDVNDNHHNVRIDTTTTLVPMYKVTHSEENTKEVMINLYKDKIESLGMEIKHLRKLIKELE